MAQRLGKPTAMFGQGFGPLTHPLLSPLVEATAPRLCVIGLREGLASVPLLLAHRVARQRITVTGDDALLVATSATRPQTGSAIGLNIRVAPYSGVDATASDRIVSVACEAAGRHGARIVALPVEHNKSGSDLAALEARGSRRADTTVSPEIADIRTPGELAERVARCRVVVTGSYHAAVFGLAAGVPAICITNSGYYDRKFEGLAAMFPGGCRLLRHGPLLERDLTSAIDIAWETGEVTRDGIHSAALHQVSDADQIYERFQSLVAPDAHAALGADQDRSRLEDHP
jgi:colanic acid/amylovoran biosynthesis protein